MTHVNYRTFSVQAEILEEALTKMDRQGQLPPRQTGLHHYTTLETTQKILESDNIRLSHAEYSNDQREMEEAKRVITACLSASTLPAGFIAAVTAGFANAAPHLDANIFCMSTGSPDILSQWRAYGQDGRGATITLAFSHLADYTYHLPGLRINPVFYDPMIQRSLVDSILAAGNVRHAGGDPTAVDATIAALVFTTPLMKDVGFAEEQEWRLIFMPPSGAPQPTLKFYPRRDFLAPYVELQDLWFKVRPALLEIDELRRHIPINKRMLPSGNPLIPATDIIVGPSGHQPLNERTMSKVLAQCGRTCNLGKSTIPYRSLA
jgi:hypothetical protein